MNRIKKFLNYIYIKFERNNNNFIIDYLNMKERKYIKKKLI